jgi:hypothetical protein
MTLGVKHTLQGIITAWISCFALPAALHAGVETREWRFRVFLDDSEIGYHHFHLTENGTATRLTSNAAFDVTLLKIPVFTYRHENTEHWNSGCLQSITSVTDDNGERYRVDGDAEDNGFRLTTADREALLPACISTFAYWDRSFLQHRQLLNPQTGEYLPVEVEYLGERTFRTGAATVAAHSYRLDTDDLAMELWYAQDGHWIALQSTLDGGRLLRYVIE